MMRIVFLLLGFTFSLSAATFLSCSNDKKKSLNPNGDSELALLMREMFDDGMLTKQQLLKGENPEVRVKYHRIHTAKPTVPEKVSDPKYAGFAALYEASVQSLLESNEETRAEAWHSMVDACMNCHKEICPGPRMKIKKLYMTEEEIAGMIQVRK